MKLYTFHLAFKKLGSILMEKVLGDREVKYLLSFEQMVMFWQRNKDLVKLEIMICMRDYLL